MNYYSDVLINNIIDGSEDDELIDAVDEFYNTTTLLMLYYTRHTMNANYVKHIAYDRSVKYAYYCIDTSTFNVINCPSVLAYKTVKKPQMNYVHYYILLICTKPKYQKLGYATALLSGFIQRHKSLKTAKTSTAKIILSSVEEAVTYYEKVGFVWTRKNIQDYPPLLDYEHYDPKKEYFMMEYDI